LRESSNEREKEEIKEVEKAPSGVIKSFDKDR